MFADGGAKAAETPKNPTELGNMSHSGFNDVGETGYNGLGDKMGLTSFDVTGGERKVLSDYQYSSYQKINRAARSGGLIKRQTLKEIITLDNLTHKAALPENVMLYRGVGSITRCKLPRNIEELVGYSYLDNRFLSTSTSREFSKR